jgi:hypothetical protein
VMRGIEEIRANTARTLELLEEPQAGGRGRAPRRRPPRLGRWVMRLEETRSPATQRR